MWQNTKITQLLKIKYPILLGPMGGGFGSVDLLSIVSNAGGLGSYGAYTLTPEQLLDLNDQIRLKTQKPYNINLWVSDVDHNLSSFPQEERQHIIQRFKPYFDMLGLSAPDIPIDIPSKFEQQVEVLLKIRPAVFSFIFGIPSKEVLKECRNLNIKTVGSATTLDEGLELESAGVDAIIAAGSEGGGHRPSFLKPPLESLTGTFTLVQQLKNEISKPIIAAGGIIDGKGVAAALTLGADGVQLGTAFLACEESNASSVHRNLLFSDRSASTILTKVMTGRLGRTIRNTITDDATLAASTLPFPLQARLLSSIKAEAIARNRPDLVNFWSGQNTSSLKHRKANDLMQALISETSQLLK